MYLRSQILHARNLHSCRRLLNENGANNVKVPLRETEHTVSGSSDAAIHRVKIFNLPSKDNSAVKRLFESLGIKRLRKSPQWDYGFLNFQNETLKTKYIKISQEEIDKQFEAKKKAVTEELQQDHRTPAEQLADQVTPLAKLPYEAQLRKKNRKGIKQLLALRRKLTQLPDLTEASKAQIAWAFTKEDLPFDILDPIGSPVIDGYRSKCEFSIGKDLDGKPTVGFMLGLYREGITAVMDPSACIHIPDTAKRIAKATEEYIQSSEHPVYDKVNQTGVWRSLMTKTQRSGDVMIVLQIKVAELSEQEIAAEKKKLVSFYTDLQQQLGHNKVNVATVLLQLWDGRSTGITEKAPTEVLLGDGYIYEDMLDHKFRISSQAFFQVNTSAAEELYKKCAEWCHIDRSKKTTLLDLCCGTGTIGITMSKSVDRVIGIDIVPEAIADAQANAALNNIENVEFTASKIEDRLDMIAQQQNDDVVAVLDPPRCDAKQALPNFISLCKPTSRRFTGAPFVPSRAVIVDLFPHTEHYELMVEFVRQPPSSATSPPLEQTNSSSVTL
ncbi:S-adenosyl-L-methionine-dependent methyltransferase [Radiomyces spectabilis]|uniref:S-adenosyl-L-methionine-dependent methyltransferase n=1 Tax=Radiomyces spectabilis TaxID=64574 RepID=UPI00221FE656|nr:S-adenosyl-L-methionine-dependent methyltransferase [Radiomyces spectabilis]KAI8370452.1 S-adenosyl-L-methionine-dependent methyltransferase [Radiomyces spectabilis]